MKKNLATQDGDKIAYYDSYLRLKYKIFVCGL